MMMMMMIIFSNNNKITTERHMVVSTLLRIREVSGSNLGPETGYLD
jgi:hypothetical protein